MPTIAEILPGYKRDGSHVMLAPAILNRISNEVRRIFDLADVKDRLKNFDDLLLPSTPQELDQIIRADIEKRYTRPSPKSSPHKQRGSK